MEEGSTSAELIAARSVGGRTVLVARRDGSTVLGRLDGGALVVELDLGSRDAHDLFGTSADDDLWIVDGDGVARFDGAAWSPVPVDAGRDAYVRQIAGQGVEVFAIAWDAADAREPSLVLRHTPSGFVPDDAPRGALLATTASDLFLLTGDGSLRRSDGEWVAIDPPPFGPARASGDALTTTERTSVALYRDGAWETLPDLPLHDVEPATEEGDPYEQLEQLLVVGDDVLARVSAGHYECASGSLFSYGTCGQRVERVELYRHSPATGWAHLGGVDESWRGGRLLTIDGAAWLADVTDRGTRLGRVGAR